MIAYLSGTIQNITPQSVVIVAQGVGYQVFIAGRVVEHFSVNDSIELEIITVVKENAIDLYGFIDYKEKQVFQYLTSISGVGPKSALSILNASSADEILSAVLNQNPSILEKVSGIGKKTAERIVLELKNKIAKDLETTLFDKAGTDVEVIEALQGLGYEATEIREVVKKLDKDLSVEEKIKQVLQSLGK